jgi:branched-chain amino acid transport system permease protein
MARRAEAVWPLLVLSALLCAIVAIASIMAPSTQRVVTDGLLKLIAVVGAYIFIGNSGVLSFGHIGFMAIGAYTSAWLTIPPMTKKVLLPALPEVLMRAHWDTVSATVAGGLAAALVALLAGLPLMRLSGIAASIGTFAILAIIQATFSNWTSMTGGQGSLFGLPASTDMYVAVAWALAALAGAYAYQRSRFGFRLRSSSEEEVAARASGVNVPRERLIAFVVSAFFVGVAGALHAHFLGVVTANQYFLGLTFITLAMLVIGGISSLSGAVIGVVAVSLLAELLRRVEGGFAIAGLAVPQMPGLREVGLALVMLLILVFRPRGITGGREIAWPGRHRAKATIGQRKAGR